MSEGQDRSLESLAAKYRDLRLVVEETPHLYGASGTSRLHYEGIARNLLSTSGSVLALLEQAPDRGEIAQRRWMGAAWRDLGTLETYLGLLEIYPPYRTAELQLPEGYFPDMPEMGTRKGEYSSYQELYVTRSAQRLKEQAMLDDTFATIRTA